MSTEREGRLAGVAWLLTTAELAISRIPQGFDLHGRELRCHELTRAVWSVVCESLMCSYLRPKWLRVVDGTYAGVDHSWIEMTIPAMLMEHRSTYFIQYPPKVSPTAGPRSRAILDVYAVGSLPQVRLIECAPLLKASWELYQPGAPRSDIREDVVNLLLWSLQAERFDVAADEAQRVPEES